MSSFLHRWLRPGQIALLERQVFSMEKRLVVFLVLSIFIIFSYPYLIGWFAGPAIKVPPPEEQSTKVVDKKDKLNNDAVKQDMPVPSAGAGAPVTAIEGEKEKVVESDLYRIVLSNVGGTIKKWELKKYTKKGTDGALEPIELIPAGAKSFP